MRRWLDVPFGEKDLAKRCGARWDPAVRRWYAPRPGMTVLERWAALPDLPELLPGEDRSFGSAFGAEPIPSTTWFNNARSCISQQDWERVRRLVTGRAGRLCETCGRGENRPNGQFLDCHELWQYDSRARRQILRRLVCLCTACHGVIHFGRTQLVGGEEQAYAHLCDVTGMTRREAEAQVVAAFALWAQRSEIAWDVDLSILTDAGITPVRPESAADVRPPAAAEQARILHAPPVARTPAIPIAAQPKPAGLGSRWQRWLQTGER